MRLVNYLVIIGLLAFAPPSFSQSKIPALNQKIIDYLSGLIGKRIGHGECWDLANEALTKVNAKWDGAYKFGKPIDPSKDSIYPGDLIQFEKVTLSYEKNGMQYRESMPHHTAIVYKVNSKGNYKLAHQNTGQHGKKVGLSDFKLSDMIKGKAFFFRPESK